jgi:saccharopine dehydrogenase-like NADP-dependent oxidoreductase
MPRGSPSRRRDRPGGSARRVVVLGGGGLTGRCAVRALANGGQFDSVVAADLDPELAEASRKAAGARANAARIDVQERSELLHLLEGAAVVVNAVQYGFHLRVMEAALTARVPYLDFGGLFHMTRRQLERDEAFRSAGVLAIPGLGQVPGISNILAADGAARFDRLESVVLRDGWRDLTEGGPEISFGWSPSTFLDEMILPALVFENGRYREYPPMSGAEEFEFLPPVGRTRVYRTLHSEPATLPESLRAKGLSHCEWKEGGPGIDLLRTMALLGLASDRPLEVGGGSVVPREFTLALLRREKLLGPPAGVVPNDWEVLDIELTGSEANGSVVRHAVARFPPRPDWGFTATQYAVGVAGAIGAEFVASGEIRGAGVVPPERCVPPAPFRAALARWGIETAISPPDPPLSAGYRLPATQNG